MLLSTGVALVAAEMLGRTWLRGLGDVAAGPPAPSMLAVPFEPYLMFGAQYGWFDEGEHDVMLAREGPAAFGYRPGGGTYVYDFTDPVEAVADRGEFLFANQPLADDTAAEALRIFVIGASVARGVGASSPDRAWYALLERRLAAALGREVRFVSAAVDAYVSTQERLVFRLMVLPRCPDAVLILDGWNDAAMPAMFGIRPGDPATQGLLYQRFYAPTFGLAQLLSSYSALARYRSYRSILEALDENRRRILARADGLPRYGEDTASVYLNNLEHMLASCRRSAIPCAAFLQPARSLTQPTRDDAGSWSAQEALERAAYEEIRRRLPALQSRHRVRDLSGLFTPGEPWFLDPVHFGDRGQVAVADAMLPVVLDALGDDLRPPGTSRCPG
jgi:lysophospholipase L1-like esterase